MLHNLDQVRAFVAAAECGSFSAAARRLGRAQSVVSTHMAMLEAELGLELFERSGRNPLLTEPGRALLEEAREVLVRCGRFETLALSLGENPQAELHLALDESLPFKEVSQLCAELAARFPLLKVQLLLGATIEVNRWVELGTAHLGVAYDEPAPEQPMPDVERHWLGLVEQVAVAAKTHPLAALPRVTDRDLAAHRQIVTRFAPEADRSPHICSTMIWETNSSYTAADLVLRGLGWAFLPENVAGYVTDFGPGALTTLDYDAGIPALRIQVLWKAGRPLTPVTGWVRNRLRALLCGPGNGTADQDPELAVSPV